MSIKSQNKKNNIKQSEFFDNDINDIQINFKFKLDDCY